MNEEEKTWEELKKSQSQYKNNGGTLYFHNKTEFAELVLLMNEALQNAKEDFFNDRLLTIGTTINPLTSDSGLSYNRWEMLYQPHGKNEEEAFLTTDENGKLLNLVDIPLTDAIGSSEKILNLIECGELKANEYETNFVRNAHEQVGYPIKEIEKTVRL